MKHLFLILLFLIPLSVTAQVKSLTYKNEKRKYIVYTPKSYDLNKDKLFPIVFNFHGGGMTMAEQMLYTQMNKTADKHNFIVIYPQGIKQDWNVGFGMSYKNSTDDIGFIDTLLTVIEKEYRVDTNKIFATGLSRGGFFCHRIASELSLKFSAVASVGATLPDSVAYYNASKNYIGVMIVHGTADKIVNYNGKKNAYYSAIETYNYWKKQNEILTSNKKLRVINRNKKDGTQISILETNNKRKFISLLIIDEGGHTWAGADAFNIGLPIGKTSMGIDLNENIWAFFNKQSR